MEHWDKLTDDDWQTVAGKKDQLVGRIRKDLGPKTSQIADAMVECIPDPTWKFVKE